MSQLCRKASSDRYILAGTLAGRQGIFFDSNALPLPLVERLGLPAIGDARSLGRHGETAGSTGATPLTARQKNLVLAILNKGGDCGPREIREFVQMHPGVRDLRYRNYESSLWTQGSWKQALGRLVAQGKRLPSGFERADLIADEIYAARTMFGSICFDLGVDAPSQSERIEALMRPGELAKSQAAFFRKAAAEDGALRKELDDFKAWAGSLRPEELRHTWRRAVPNLVTAASLAHKVRFMPEPFSEDEGLLLRRLLNKPNANQDDFSRLEYAFSGDVSLYGDLMENIIKQINDPAEPVLEAARASSEFDTLIDFFELPREHVQVRLSKSPGFTKPHSNLTADHPDNDDALTSLFLIIRHPGGTRFAGLDVAFDGVSGHGGASMASRIAKDVFEIASLAGWIRSPEDVRLAAQLADLAIDIEKERFRLLAGRETGEEKARLERLRSMGTTVAASYVEGDRFYGIHCGDSDYVVVRGGDVIFRSKPHGTGNTIWAGLGIGTRAIQINNQDNCHDYSPVQLIDGDAVLTFTDGIGDVLCDHEYGTLVPANANNAPALTAAIVSAADFRKDPYLTYRPGCGCDAIGGKDDDMTLIARFIRLQENKP